MALGSWDLPLAVAPEIEPHLQYYNFIRYWWGEVLLYTGVLLDRDPGDSGYRVGGRHIEWLLGSGSEGPITERKEWLAGENKIPDPSFDYGSAHWRYSESTQWSVEINPGLARTPSGVARLLAETTKDDPLTAIRDMRVAGGQFWNVSMWANHLTSTPLGLLHLCINYKGKFDTPNLLPNGNMEAGVAYWTLPADVSIVTDPVNAREGTGVMKIGPIVPYQPITNGSFESGLTGWVQVAGAWLTSSAAPAHGANDVYTAGGGPNPKSLQADSSLVTPLVADGFSCREGEEWIFEGHGRGDATADGEAHLQFLAVDADPTKNSWLDVVLLRGTDGDKTQWHFGTENFRVPEDKNFFVPMMTIYGHTAGEWHFDGVNATRIKGNHRIIINAQFMPMVAERSYTVEADCKFDAGATGSVKILMALYGSGRETLVVESGVMEPTGGTYKRLSFQVTPPSGYYVGQLVLDVADVYSGSAWIDSIKVFDSDPTTTQQRMTWDSTVTGWTNIATTIAVPNGAYSAEINLLAEQGSTGWLADDINFSRYTAGITTAADVIQDALVDPRTSNPVLTYGLSSALPLKWDFLVEYQTAKEIIQRLCRSGLVDANLEWKTTPDGVFSANVPEALFADRSSTMILRPRDQDVLLIDSPATSVETVVNEIKLVGADQAAVGGQSSKVVANVIQAGGPRSLSGLPLSRAKLVQDSGVNHPDYARAKAQYELEAQSVPGRSFQLNLVDWRLRGEFVVGDWIGVYNPDSEQEGNVAVPLQEGVVWPEKIRVQSRKLSMARGDGFRVEIINSANRVIPIPDELIIWADKTVATVEVGELEPEFAVDSDGLSAYRQLLDYRRRLQG